MNEEEEDEGKPAWIQWISVYPFVLVFDLSCETENWDWKFGIGIWNGISYNADAVGDKTETPFSSFLNLLCRFHKLPSLLLFFLFLLF